MRLTLMTALIIATLSISACQTLEDIKQGFTPADKPHSINIGEAGDQPASCPSFKIVEDLDTYYEIPKTSDPKEDVGFAMARAVEIRGSCKYENEQLVLGIDLEFEAVPGPFSKMDTASGAKLSAPYFVAVVDEHKKIIAKDVFDVNFDLGKLDEIDLLHRETLKQIIPLTAGRQPEKYEIMAGFQLDQSQLEYARQRKATEVAPAAGDMTDSNAFPDPLAMAE